MNIKEKIEQRKLNKLEKKKIKEELA